MDEIEKLLAWAVSQIGIKADSRNICKYNITYYGTENIAPKDTPWCVMFVWYGCKAIGRSDLFYSGGKVASCTMLYQWASNKGYVVPKSQIKRGDLIIFEFAGGSRHIGICEDVDDATVTTIDGNTCAVGDEANGMQVMRRRRALSYVKWVIRLPFKQMLEKPNAKYYVVKKGEWFDLIATRHGLTHDKLVQLNPQIKNPSLIYVGQKIRIK